MSHSNSFSTINEINEKFDYIIIISKMLKNIEKLLQKLDVIELSWIILI